MHIDIVGASPISKTDPIEPLTIAIKGEPPTWRDEALASHAAEYDWMKTADRFYSDQARQIVHALTPALPQGTMDRLLIQLLQARAVYFRIPGEVVAVNEAMEKALKCVLLFWRHEPWGEEQNAEWRALSGGDEPCTSKALCDIIHDVLAKATAVRQ